MKLAGVPEADFQFCLDHCDEIPNLQILANIPNIERSGTPFDKWLVESYPAKRAKAEFCYRQFIPEVDVRFANFREFFDLRSELMRKELRSALQGSLAATPGT